MRYLIIYSTKTGSAKKCAALLATNLNMQNCSLCDINNETPDLSGYDAFIVGSYVRMGRMDKKIVSFVKNHQDDMPFGIFECGCFPDRFSENIQKNFSDDILEKAIVCDFFGADFKLEKYKGFDRCFASAMNKVKEKDPGFKICDKIMIDRITSFANELSNYSNSSFL